MLKILSSFFSTISLLYSIEPLDTCIYIEQEKQINLAAQCYDLVNNSNFIDPQVSRMCYTLAQNL